MKTAIDFASQVVSIKKAEEWRTITASTKFVEQFLDKWLALLTSSADSHTRVIDGKHLPLYVSIEQVHKILADQEFNCTLNDKILTVTFSIDK